MLPGRDEQIFAIPNTSFHKLPGPPRDTDQFPLLYVLDNPTDNLAESPSQLILEPVMCIMCVILDYNLRKVFYSNFNAQYYLQINFYCTQLTKSKMTHQHNWIPNTNSNQFDDAGMIKFYHNLGFLHKTIPST